MFLVINGALSLERATIILEINQPLLPLFLVINAKPLAPVSSKLSAVIQTHQFWNWHHTTRLKIDAVSSKWTFRNMVVVSGEHGSIVILAWLERSLSRARRLRKLHLIFGILSKRLSIFQTCVFISTEDQMTNSNSIKKTISSLSWARLLWISLWGKVFNLTKTVMFLTFSRRISRHLSID